LDLDLAGKRCIQLIFEPDPAPRACVAGPHSDTADLKGAKALLDELA
jgi:hypothetical protein